MKLPPVARLTARVGRCIAIACALMIDTSTAMAQAAVAPPAPAIADGDRVRLAEARRLIATFGDSLWEGWSAAPMALILITPAHEYLLWHSRPSGGFQRIGYDSLLATDVHARPRQFAPGLAATFPAVGGVPTVVIGTTEGTRMSSTKWVLTVAHEHFHQWQTSRPGYYAGVAALDLAKGDSTGMWMLNYAFPYTTASVAERYARLAAALRSALTDTTPAARPRHRATVDSARAQLRSAVEPADLRYLDFQLWQEGIARYTEYRIARDAATRYTPTAAFSALPDAEPFAAVADRLRREILTDDNTMLGREQRVAFYPVGAALGLWLDETEPGWRSRYIEANFTLDRVGRVRP